MTYSLMQKIDKRFNMLRESANNVSWKEPFSANYDRQQAENALQATLGPMTNSPTWSKNWVAPNGHEHLKGQPAPQWSADEIFVAIAGDAALLGKKDLTGAEQARSPRHGGRTAPDQAGQQGRVMSGAPLWRWATQQARRFDRMNMSDIMDAYQNGAVQIMTMLRAGADESRVNIISWMKRDVIEAMGKGVGLTGRAKRVIGSRATGVTGLEGVLATKDPEAVRDLANQVKGKYQQQKLPDKHDDNPFEQYSSDFYKLTMSYADALENNDEDNIFSIKQDIQDFIEKVKKESEGTLGFERGQGEAITDLSRGQSKNYNIQSMDAPTGDDEGSAAGNVEQQPRSGLDSISRAITDPRTVSKLVDLTLRYDMNELLNAQDPAATVRQARQRVHDYAKGTDEEPGFHKGMKDIAPGKMKAMELRMIIRTFGIENFDGKGAVRSNTDVPRDGQGWWRPGEDPEIEPYVDENGQEALWESVWMRGSGGSPEDSGYIPPMTELLTAQGFNNRAVQDEFAQETKEFQKLGIPTVREIKVGTSKRDKGREITLSTVSINKAQISGLSKIAAAAQLIRGDVIPGADSLGEDIRKTSAALFESADSIDRQILLETCNYVITMYNKVLVNNFMMDIYETKKR
jgi:hypothetical protein